MGLSVKKFDGVETKLISLSINNVDKVDKQLIHQSIMRYDGVGAKRIILEDIKSNQTAGNVALRKANH